MHLGIKKMEYSKKEYGRPYQVLGDQDFISCDARIQYNFSVPAAVFLD